MATILQDVRYGFRMLAKNPGLSAVIVLTLALAIGANTTVFTIVNAVLLGNVPVEQPEQLITLWSQQLKGGPDEQRGLSFPDFEDFQKQAKAFQGLSYFTFYNMTVSDPGRPAEQFEGARVSWNAFSLLGVKPILGRDFAPEDDIPGAATVAILGYDFWQSRYGGDPNVLGKTIRINEDSKVIVGVMGPGMKFPYNESFWFPIRLNANIRANREQRGYPVFGRLAEGVTLNQANTEVKLVATKLEQAYPDKNKGISAFVQTYNGTFSRGPLRLVLLFLLGAVGFVLLIACANVANLLITRSLSRTKEVSIRSALGASRGRIVRQLLLESLLLGVAGSALGFLLSIWGVRMYVAAIPKDWSVPYWMNFAPDYRVFAFLAAICVTTSLLFGLVPALQTAKVDVNSALKEGARGSSGGRARYLSRALIVAEVSLSLVLLVGAGLMIRSFLNQYEMSSGLEHKSVMTVSINLLGPKYNSGPNSSTEVRNFYKRLEPESHTLTEVDAVAITSSLPMSWSMEWPLELEAHPVADPKQAPPVQSVVISPGYFDVLGVPLRRGRAFTARDGLPGQTSAIINERFAAKYWPGENPIGKRLRLLIPKDDMRMEPQAEWPWLTVVGVAPDMHHRHPSQQPEIAPLVYVPFEVAPPQRYMVMMARNRAGDAHALTTPLRSLIARVNPDITLTDVLSLPEHFSRARFYARLYGSLFVIFATIGVLLAAIGIFAVMAYSVNQRRREIGIRMALGAQANRIVKLVLGQGMALTLIGVAIGVAGAFALTRLMARLVVNVPTTDPATFVAVAVLLSAVAGVACYLPARRATRVDPTIALRSE